MSQECYIAHLDLTSCFQSGGLRWDMLTLKSAFLESILLPVFMFHVDVKSTEMT